MQRLYIASGAFNKHQYLNELETIKEYYDYNRIT